MNSAIASFLSEHIGRWVVLFHGGTVFAVGRVVQVFADGVIIESPLGIRSALSGGLLSGASEAGDDAALEEQYEQQRIARVMARH